MASVAGDHHDCIVCGHLRSQYLGEGGGIWKGETSVVRNVSRPAERAFLRMVPLAASLRALTPSSFKHVFFSSDPGGLANATDCLPVLGG